MLWRLILLTIGCGLTLMHGAVPAAIVHAGEGAVTRQLTEQCATLDATGKHQPLESAYTVNGTCTFFENGVLDPIHAVNWTATGSHQPNTKVTVENIKLAYFESGKEKGTGFAKSTMQCGTDP